MFRIVNDNIFISRGETAFYNKKVIMRDGTPMIITTTLQNPTIEFVVRPTAYSRGEDYIFRVWLRLTGTNPELDIKQFDSVEVIDYLETSWDNDVPPTEGNENKLHRLITNNVATFRYYDYDLLEWVEYSFNIRFQFPYYSISQLEPNEYVYEISLLAGNLTNNDPNQSPVIPSFKYQILTPHLFKVGGSISE